MFRFLSVVVAGLLAAAPASAGSWADAMFQESGKDFGLAPRGPTLSHYFAVTNKSDKTVHISGVRVSCGCTTAQALQNTLAPGQSTAVQALMDTRRFVGHKQVTVYVTFDQPQWDEVSLFVRAYGSDDLSFSPGEFTFPGKVQAGTPASAKVVVQFNGGHWQILGVDRESSFITPALKEIKRDATSASYEVSVNLSKDTPPGKWFTDVWLKTSQEGMPKIRIPLMVEVEPKPAKTVAFGEIKAGQSSERKITLKGSKPFRVTRIEGTDAEIFVKGGDKPNTTQEIVVTVKPSKAGDLEHKLIVFTDEADQKEIPLVAVGKVIR